MERFVKGDVLILSFPFSDLGVSKKRPSLVVATLKGDDIILSQITSQSRNDLDAIKLKQKDFKQGNLKIDSWIRPNKLFTVESSIIRYKIGNLRREKIKEVENKLCEIFTR